MNRDTAYLAFIFITGAAVLALEVLASRIMTPYFGVSLYIWASILSITLVSLAVGYQLGGKLTGRLSEETLEVLFLSAPVASSLSLALACAVYPVFFPWLTNFDLVVGCFVAGVVLLVPSLITLSSLNPILIAMRRRHTEGRDAGAGQVLFISTIGSVAGVLLTAFLLIPNMANFRATLGIGVLLSLLAACFALAMPARRAKPALAASCLCVALICGALFLGHARYRSLLAELGDGQVRFDVLAEYRSHFGNIKVVEMGPEDGQKTLGYIQDGLIQNLTTPDGRSMSAYTYSLLKLGRAFGPAPRNALVLGLGPGVVPRALKHAGASVAVVDINADSVLAAKDHFGFRVDDYSVHVEDARTLVHRCHDGFDIAVLDLYHGENMPDYLMTAEFFRDLERCLRPGGAMILHAYFDEQDEAPNRRMLATVAAAFPQTFVFRGADNKPSLGGHSGFIVGASGAVPTEISLDVDDVPAPLREDVYQALRSGEPLAPDTDVAPVTDDHNVFALLNAANQLRTRKVFANLLPPHILMN